VTQTLGTRPGSEERVPEVDPRIQARRDLVAQERTSRRRRRLVVAAVVVAVAAVAWGVTHSPLLAVRRVVVTGTTHVPAAAVVAASGIHDGEHLVDVDEGRARARLLALPWVADAHVDVSWQGTAHLSVTERTPVAAVVSGPHRWLLVDGKGRALAGVAAVGPGRMVISGVAPVRLGQTYGAGLAAPLVITTTLHPGLRSRIAGIVVAKDGSVVLRLRSGGVARLCQPADLADKLASLTTVFAHVDDRGIRVVDVCIPDSPVITRTQGA
jgi:cell division protein FtsQ